MEFDLDDRPRSCNPFDRPNGPDYPNDNCSNMFVTPSGGGTQYGVNVSTQYQEGIDKLVNDEFDLALDSWESTATMSDADRDSSDLKCQLKVDFARTYIPRYPDSPLQPFVSQGGNNTVKVSSFDLTVSPNPTSGKFTIRTTGGSYLTRIFDTFGKLVYMANFTDNTAVDLSKLNTGMYFVQVQNADNAELETRRIVIE